MWKPGERSVRVSVTFRAFLAASAVAYVTASAQEPPVEQDPEREVAAAQAESADSPASAADAVSPEERAKLIEWLREAYGKPPAEWPEPTLDPGRPHQEIGTISGKPEAPADNPTTKDKARLGLQLFFDPRLSGAQGVACASCHEPQLGWSNGVAFSFGVHRKTIHRHPQTLVGVGFRKTFFWDGRANTLEEQARDVILNSSEMSGEPAEIVKRLEAEPETYPPLFEKAFGDAKISFDRVVKAIAAFERSIVTGRTKFDRFLGGKADLSDSELSGLHLFRTKARCMNCHMGPMFTDDEFHNLGLTYYGRKFEDLGRYYTTNKPENVGEFRTPTLRNVARTAPYMHNGVFPHLDGILRLYNVGMPRPKPKEAQIGDPLFPKTSELLKRLELTAAEMADLKAFLESLNEPLTRVVVPPIPEIRPRAASVVEGS